MAIIVLLVCFVSVFLCLGISSTATSRKELLMGSALVFSTILVGITELLGLFHLLNYRFIFMSWSFTTVLFITYLYTRKEHVKIFTNTLKAGIKLKLSQTNRAEKAFLIASGVILLLIFLQSIFYPPNNWDAMTYHMARITSWISHQSLAHYPTDITRQLYQPPFAEYVIMNFGILSRSDVFSNTVQYFFLLFSLITLLSIVESLGLNRPYKIIALVLGITVPEVILQSSSTQNDLTEGFFVITTCFFAIKIIKDAQLKYYVFAGLAVGLSLLTKGTAYIYLPPVLLLLGIIIMIQVFKNKKYRYLNYALLAFILAVAINSGHFARNYKLTHGILGVDKAESKLYSNQKMNAGLLASNIIKNAGLHTGIMFVKPASAFANKTIYKLHDIAGISINDTATNYRNIKYSAVTYTTDEEGSPNPFHFLFMLISLVLTGLYFLKGKHNSIAIFIAVSLIIQFLFFCLYLKWQPWHSRLHIPLFLMAVPLMCYYMSMSPWFRRSFYWLSPLMLVYALLVVIHTDRRPLSNKLFESQYKKYFIGNPTLYPEYAEVNNNLQKSDYKNIGLMLGVDDWEYPLFKDCFSKEINPVYIAVDNFSKDAGIDTSKIDCIISTIVNKPFIDFKGKRYTNITNGHKIIWLYQ